MSNNNINLVNSVATGLPSTFNKAEAISSASFTDVISIGSFTNGFQAGGAGAFTAYVVPFGSTLEMQDRVSGDFVDPATTMQWNLMVTVPTDGNPLVGRYSLESAGGLISHSGVLLSSDASNPGVQTLDLVGIPIGNLTLQNITITVTANLDTKIFDDTACCVQSADFSDPLSFIVLGPDGNVIPDLVVNSQLGFQYQYGTDTGAAPLPATLPLFATGLGGLGFFGWRRKRKAQTVA